MILDIIWERLQKETTPLNLEALKKAILSGVIVKVQNVADYYYHGTSQHYFNLYEDFPNMAPPWRNIWMEWKTPPYLISEHLESRELEEDGQYITRLDNGLFKKIIEPRLELGAYITAVDLQKDRTFEVFEKSYSNPMYGMKDALGVRWIITLDFFGANTTLAYFGRTSIFLNQEGNPFPLFQEGNNVYFFSNELLEITAPSIIKSSKKHENGLAAINRETLQEFEKEVIDGIGYFLDSAWKNIACLALSFINCRNVIKREEQFDEKLVKSRQSKAKFPVTKFLTLEIGPISETAQTEEKSDQPGSKRSLHICRGHFAKYDERPLFGKHRGTFWIPMHVRGTKEAGEIKKDYAVKIGA